MSSQPRGVARTTYTKPCPWCGQPPKRDERVTRIDLKGTRLWWHEECRNLYLDELRAERMLT